MTQQSEATQTVTVDRCCNCGRRFQGLDCYPPYCNDCYFDEPVALLREVLERVYKGPPSPALMRSNPNLLVCRIQRWILTEEAD